MTENNPNELSSNMKQLRDQLVNIQSVLASLQDINSDARVGHSRALGQTIGSFEENAQERAARKATKKKDSDSLLRFTQKQIWSQVASAVTKAVKRGL